MKINKYISPILLVAILATSSCKKNFLDITPTDRLSDVSITSDSSLFEDYVINRYMGARLQDKEGEGSPPGFGRGFEYALWSSITDESIYNNDDNTWLIQRGQLAPENLGIAGTIWARSYRSIRECNYALQNIDKVKMSEEHKTRLTGELEFIRAFRYHDLIRNYGGVVLVGDTVTNLNDDLQSPGLFKRSSLKDCIDYTVQQLDNAAQKLPTDNSNSWQLGRATKGAALALKSRLLLYAASPLYNVGSWTDAAAAAKAVMDMGKYTLYQGGYDKLFLTADNPGSYF